ncbi:unnamed protein product [Gulo gulo]|uniref:Histone H2B n=1 Tax=Gulo gulo TaxID=48420 RepID=A0A9X9M067_GULGU|nr:unnamed protein product [Gulo gulo]
MDSFIKDIFERIADKASLPAHSTKPTIIISREIQTAVRLLLQIGSSPSLRPARPSSGTPSANELPQDRLTTLQTKGSFQSHLT